MKESFSAAPVPPAEAVAAINDAEDLEGGSALAIRDRVGAVVVDSSQKQVRLPMLKIRQSNSGKVLNPNLPMGALTLDLEHIVTDPKGLATLVVVSYAEFLEDNVGLGQPKNTYPNLKAAIAAGKRLVQRGEPAGTPNTVREAGRAIVLIEKPADLMDSAFPFELEGKRYAAARWFLNGWTLWGPGRTIYNKSETELKPVGLMAGRFELQTVQAQGTAGPYHKASMRLLPERNSKAFQAAAMALFEGKSVVSADE